MPVVRLLPETANKARRVLIETWVTCLAILIIPLFFSLNHVFAFDDNVGQEAISISGTLLMLDNRTPHIATVVQAVIPPSDRQGEPVIAATTLSDEDGRYRFINLRPGRYQVRCYIPGEYLYYGQKTAASQGAILQVEHARTLNNIDFQFPPIKRGVWRHYTRMDGLAHNTVNKIHVDPDGFLWLGTDTGGISRFDGNQFVNFTREDGLPPMPSVFAIHQTDDNVMWFGMFAYGVYRYDGQSFLHFGAEVEGLANAYAIFAINSDASGALWFGTYDGLYRYADGKFDKFTTKEGLAGNTISIIHAAPDGMMWFFTENGASRYDGKEFTNLAFKDALVNHASSFTSLTNDHTMPIHRSSNGELWCAPRATVPEIMRTGGFGVFGYNGERYTHLTIGDGLPHNRVVSIQSTTDGALWFGIWGGSGGGGMSRYDGKNLVNFTPQDGLPSNTVKQLYTDADGVIWVASGSGADYFKRGGLSRYDPKGLVNFTTKDGLPNNSIRALHRSPDGALWIGTLNGVARYNGQDFTSFTTKDGLANNYVTTIKGDHNGILWFGTGDYLIGREGVSRYDTRTGRFLKPLTTEDGLTSNNVHAIYTAADGVIWFGTNAGISRYDTKTGEFLPPFKKEANGLPDNTVARIICDPDGVLWFGSLSLMDFSNVNVTRYDGKQFEPSQEGLEPVIRAFHRDPDKVVWAGTSYGVFQYDGKELSHVTQKDGFVDSQVHAMYPNLNGLAVLAPDEVLWLGTDSSGVCFYDGVAWSSLDTRDGLAGNTVTAIAPGADGSLWFGTNDGGLTHYHRSSSRPRVYITSVTTDETYRDLAAIPALTTGTRVTIKYNAIDFKTIPEKRQYRYRLKPVDSDWRKSTKETFFDDSFDEPGVYTFEVQAIDRDLNYSLPAQVTLKVVPPFYLRASFLLPTVGGGMILIAVLIIISIGYFTRRREVQAYQKLAVQELQDAKRVQMSLMPDTAPPIEGVEIAGKCISANTVSGDFFDYLTGNQPHEVALVVADVCGKAMKGAMNAVMTDGILHMAAEEMEKLSPASLLMKLNNILKARLEQYMNVTMVIGTIDSSTMTLTLANAAHHAYPLLLRFGLSSDQRECIETNGEIQTLKTGGLPLGMKAGIKYSEEQYPLQSGDVLIFMTDGIIEAQDSEERLYSDSGRLENSILKFTPDMPAEAMVEAIINDAIAFGGEKAQRDDDMTVVVAKVL